MTSSGATGGVRAWAAYVLTALMIWLGWQIVLSVLVQKAPVETAVRLAPSSGQALSRAAEAELTAGRTEQAAELAEAALRATPFDVRALRVFGLALARTDADRADPILTLAGNWSLRDDPTHAWLIDRRLRQGDYAGAFGHADMLARRRESLHPQLFELFTTAAIEDPRSRPALARRLADKPNWRGPYLRHLAQAGDEGAVIQSVLAMGLEDGQGRLSDLELGAMYSQWMREGRLAGVQVLRARLGRPGAAAIQNGGFEDDVAIGPFGWSLTSRPGLTPLMSGREDGRGRALFVESDGYRGGIGAVQVLSLKPGPWRLNATTRFDVGGADPRLEWRVTCLETGASLATWEPAGDDDGRWRRTALDFTVPQETCSMQRLELRNVGGTRRTTVIVWFDDLQIEAGR